jgi:predicted nucleotidyltransferase
MIAFDPNVEALERVAATLGPLMDELMLVGGCAVGLLITDKTISPIRATVDVDLVTEVASIPGYYELGDRLKQVGFSEYGDPICRWVSGSMLIDVVPTQNNGFMITNPWYASAAIHAVNFTLASSQTIRLISAPYFLATKFVAFNDRGDQDYMHHDMEDIVTVINGRPEVVNEVKDSDADVKAFLQAEFEDLILDDRFLDQLEWLLAPDLVSQERFPIIVARLRQLSGF